MRSIMEINIPKQYSCIEPFINDKSDECSYCEHLDPLILVEGKHTYITIAIGQIVEGYLQICAQKHRTAATGLLSYETEELIKMKKVVRDSFLEVYGTSGIAFEHGKAGSCLWGEKRVKNMTDLCHHFHLHFVPRDINIRTLIKEYLPNEIIVRTVQELKKVREEILEAEPYLYFEDSSEIGYVYPVEDRQIPRQFLRTCVAKALGSPERADWMTYPGIEFFDDTKKNLQSCLEKNYRKIVLKAA